MLNLPNEVQATLVIFFTVELFMYGLLDNAVNISDFVLSNSRISEQ
jgi:hypothetical protein